MAERVGAAGCDVGPIGGGVREKRPVDQPVQLRRSPETVRSGGKPDGPARPAEMDVSRTDSGLV